MMGLLPYDPTDDVAAFELIGRNLHHPNPRVWKALYQPEYAEQTYRVLQAIELKVVTSFTYRKAEVDQAILDHRDGVLPWDEYRAGMDEYQDWKGRTVHFRECVQRRRKEIEPYLKQTRMAEAERSRNGEHDLAFDSLAKLAKAVAEHRDGLEPADATVDDRMLWARLDTLRIPSGRGTSLTLAEFVARVGEKQRRREEAKA